MTKEEYLMDIKPFSIWAEQHDRDINSGLLEMSEYFNVMGFIDKYRDRVCRDIAKTILYDAWTDHNYILGEMDDYISRMFYLPYEAVVEFRTKKFWDEIEEEKL